MNIIARSTVIDGPGTEPHRVVLYKRDHDFHPYVVHYQWVKDESVLFQGAYCETVYKAACEFERRMLMSQVRDEALKVVWDNDAEDWVDVA